MGRRSHTRALKLWMNGEFVGTWSILAHAVETLQYADSWVASPQGHPMSLSVPFIPGNPPHRGDAVPTYFENLLPDSKDIRERVARRFQAGSTDVRADGRNWPRLRRRPGATPGCCSTCDGVQEVHATPLDDAAVVQVLRNTLAPAAVGGRDKTDEEELRISIAGAQEKTALLLVQRPAVSSSRRYAYYPHLQAAAGSSR